MKPFLSIVAFAVMLPAAHATVRTVTCQNNPAHFLPVTVNAVCGDTIRWTWVAGVHIVGPVNSSAIPNGALMWNEPIDINNKSTEYVVTVAGNYHYVCHPATPHNEDGYIVVTCATAVPQYNTTGYFSNAYPNPFADKITIETPDADLILIYNILGEKIKILPLENSHTKVEADLSSSPGGIYFYMIIKEGVVLETRRIIKGS